MRSRPVLLAAGLLSIAVAAYAPVAIARQTTAAHESRAAYSSDERDFTVGRTVYLRSTKTKIGRILAVDEDHEFPSSFRRRHARAVLMRHVDGPFDWLPVEGLSRVYVVR
jgi:hypothetical protein